MHICLFDIDGTLIRSGGAGRDALNLALEEGFDVAPPIHPVELHGRTDRAICQDLFLNHGISSTEENWTRLQHLYLERLPGLLKQRSGAVLPGVRPLLTLLRQRVDVRLGLLTGNSQRGAAVKLEHFGLQEFFEFGGFGDTSIHRDDVAREALRSAAKTGEAAGSESIVWVIGDTPADIRSGRAIGAKVVAVATGMHTVEELEASEPDFLFPDLSQSSDWVRLWGQR